MNFYKSLFISAIIVLFGSPVTFAQKAKVVETEFTVRGVCNMCKTRIENAAYIKGVKKCEWNKSTQKLTVVYNPQKVELKKIHKSIAEAGHETNLVKANPKAYDKLPACCAYQDGVEMH